MKLSVIIIGRNEEQHIARSIRSVLAAAETDDTEVLYVDSASTDRTVSIVQQYGIRIIQLRPEWPLTSSAGRYLGFINTTGEYVMFVDGDTVIYKTWLKKAMDYLEQSEQAAGTAGIVHEIFLDERGNRTGIKKNRYNTVKTGPVHVFGGIAMYRRSVLNRTGTFNPFIKATPELELSLRIRKQGYRLIRLNEPMAITYAPIRESAAEIMRRARTGLYAMGSTLKLCRRNGLALQYIRERMGFIIQFGLGAGVFLFTSAVFLVQGNFRLLGLLMLVCLSILAGASLRKGGVRPVLVSMLKRSIILICTVRSLFYKQVPNAEEYPVDVIKPGRNT